MEYITWIADSDNVNKSYRDNETLTRLVVEIRSKSMAV